MVKGVRDAILSSGEQGGSRGDWKVSSGLPGPPMGEVSELHSQRLRTENTRHWLALASPARLAPAASSCKRPEPPLAPGPARPRPRLGVLSPGATDGRPSPPRLPGARLVRAARRVSVAVTRRLRFSLRPRLRCGPGCGAAPGPGGNGGSARWMPPRRGDPSGSPGGAQQRADREAPPLQKQARLAPPPRTQAGGGGEEWAPRSSLWKRKPSFPPTRLSPLAPPSIIHQNNRAAIFEGDHPAATQESWVGSDALQKPRGEKPPLLFHKSCGFSVSLQLCTRPTDSSALALGNDGVPAAGGRASERPRLRQSALDTWQPFSALHTQVPLVDTSAWNSQRPLLIRAPWALTAGASLQERKQTSGGKLHPPPGAAFTPSPPRKSFLCFLEVFGYFQA
ncbi:hypothetical protein NN561_003307 [Cricetulus griseus]